MTVVMFGLPNGFESKGFDRTHMNLSENQNVLMEKLAKTGKPIVAVLSTGAAVACHGENRLIAFFLLGHGLHVMVNWAMISDCIDNYYVKTGSHADGTIYAIYSFVQKLSGAITGSIGAWSLAVIHYDNLAVTQTETVRNAIYLLNIFLFG